MCLFCGLGFCDFRLNCMDDFHKFLDSLDLFILDVTHSVHSLMFIKKYVNVFVCVSLISLDFVLYFILPRSVKG